ncbi:flagellar biosynthesis protein FlhA [Acidaminobacter hydrogenoformans]|uniref:Flagellar biosynthesis protein FlhA n=1 Tax=Acidaminobacter hydrogenoformans DSM 2784 TaxID=1120920 RepID=A0A1G5RV87_9FIRM|nr:flagellar biosynthesis protein FlhA [Acidaminobacter hydrogenoformans]SCZ77768.1 flagellar biosynthesis protein FlhA [Acidaminobacter hydrogenoformans DSM 2784]
MEALTQRLGGRLGRHMDVLLAFAVVGIISIILLPVPPGVLDFLLVINISLSVTVLLLTLFTKDVLEFSAFPTLLLLLTLFRLGLNLSSTKLILGQGDAGQVIQAFAGFVTGDSYIVGAVVFVIIIIIQLVVITSGATRVAEVGARFTLDAMPGNQMAIDADLNAGMIQEEEARKRRLNLQREADFYGAMDGSSKFVKGDAMAGIIITLINLVGGVAIFVGQKGLPFGEAIDRFGRLTIGDGLVSQVPAVLVSVAAGILVTRSASIDGLGDDLGRQLFSKSKVLLVAAAVLFAFGLVPAFPTLPFFIMAGLSALTGWQLMKSDDGTAAALASEAAAASQTPSQPAMDTQVTAKQKDLLAIEIGYGLLPLVDTTTEGGDLLERILMVRRQCAAEMGFVVAPIRIRDNLMLHSSAYQILLRGSVIAEGEIYPNRFMVMDPGNGTFMVDGIETVEPTFGIKALWIEASEKTSAELHGYTVVDPTTVMVTHLKETVMTHADELIGRQEVQKLLEEVREQYSVVIDELIPAVMTLGEVQKVLQSLLREGVAINDLGTVLETLADYGSMTKDTEVLTEYVRHGQSRAIVGKWLASDGKLHVITLSQRLEDLIHSHIQKSLQGSFPALAPEVSNQLIGDLQAQLELGSLSADQVVILTSPRIRAALKNLISGSLPKVPVLSLGEIHHRVELVAVGMVDQHDY